MEENNKRKYTWQDVFVGIDRCPDIINILYLLLVIGVMYLALTGKL
jgi:hypothetical protein